MGDKTLFKLSAVIEIIPEARKRHAELWPNKRQRVEFKGELRRGKPQGKGFYWEWSISEKGGSRIEKGKVLSTGDPRNSVVGMMKAAARVKYFSWAGEGNLKYSGWSLK